MIKGHYKLDDLGDVLISGAVLNIRLLPDKGENRHIVGVSLTSI